MANFWSLIFSKLCKVVPVVHFLLRRHIRDTDAQKRGSEHSVLHAEGGIHSRYSRVKELRTYNEHIYLVKRKAGRKNPTLQEKDVVLGRLN